MTTKSKFLLKVKILLSVVPTDIQQDRYYSTAVPYPGAAEWGTQSTNFRSPTTSRTYVGRAACAACVRRWSRHTPPLPTAHGEGMCVGGCKIRKWARNAQRARLSRRALGELRPGGPKAPAACSGRERAPIPTTTSRRSTTGRLGSWQTNPSILFFLFVHKILCSSLRAHQCACFCVHNVPGVYPVRVTRRLKKHCTFSSGRPSI